MTPPRPPAELRKQGRALWRRLWAEYKFNAAETALLQQLCAVIDEIEDLRAELAASNTTVAGSKGQPVINPAFAALRDHRRLADQLVVALGLPTDDATAGSRTASKSARRRGRVASIQTVVTGRREA